MHAGPRYPEIASPGLAQTAGTGSGARKVLCVSQIVVGCKGIGRTGVCVAAAAVDVRCVGEGKVER